MGVFDSTMPLADFVNGAFKSLYMHICDLPRVSHIVPMSTRISLANAFLSPVASITVTQEDASKYDHMTPVLVSLHWLSVQQ